VIRLHDDLRPGHVDAVRALVAAAGKFRPAEIDLAAELATEALSRGAAASGYHFLLAEDEAGLRGYACYGPIAGTEGSVDLYWIAVDPARQGQGLGRRLMTAVEEAARLAGARQIYVDTSASAPYVPTRAFYAACGYVPVARLPDFYAEGDGKVIYCKRLG
jgi:GNAT superfamily N-acetyltransferase